jgi:hypothetical protein
LTVVRPSLTPLSSTWSVPQSARWLMTACETATDRGPLRVERPRHHDEGWARALRADDGAVGECAPRRSTLEGRSRAVRPGGASLTQKEVQVTMRRVGRKAQVKPGVHILRHTFCSHLAMRGAPARAIQELAGHQDLTTTHRYMHLSPAALDAAISLLDGPRAALGRGDIVEAAGVEPASESTASKDSTCVSAS